MKRLLILGIILSAVAAVAFPLLAQGDLPPTAPTIKAELGGQTFAGFPGSSCWIKTDDSPLCDFVERPALTDALSVTVGEVVVFVIDPMQPSPKSFFAALSDTPAADGSIPERDLLPTNGEFPVEGLGIGDFRVEIVASYSAPAGGEYFVSTWFLLRVSEAAALATPEATVEPTVEATTEVTAEATVESTPTEIISTPTLVATPEPTLEATAPVTVEATLEPTAAVAAVTFTPAPDETVLPTEAATSEPTKAIPVVTEAATLEATKAVIAPSTETSIPPSSTPTVEPPTATPTETLIPATATLTPPIEIIFSTPTETPIPPTNTPVLVRSQISMLPTVGLDSKTGELIFLINAPGQDLIRKFRVEVLNTLMSTSVLVNEVDAPPFDQVRVPLSVLTGGRYMLIVTALGADGTPVSDPTSLEFNYTPPTAIPSPTATLTFTPTETSGPPPSPTLFIPTVGTPGSEETPTLVPPTDIPTEVPTAAPIEVSATPTPEGVFVTFTPVPGVLEATPTLFIPTVDPTSGIPSAPPQFTAQEVPAARINVGGVESEPFAVRACVTNATGERDCGGGPLDNAPARVAAPAGSLATFTFAGITPSAVVINLFTPDGVTLQRSDQLAIGDLIAYAIPTLRGTYLLSVEVTWNGGTATYYYRLAVN